MAFVAELGCPQAAAVVVGDGVAEVEELWPGTFAANPVAGVPVAVEEVLLDLIPVVVDQVEDAGAFFAASSSITVPQLAHFPLTGAFGRNSALMSGMNRSHRVGFSSKYSTTAS